MDQAFDYPKKRFSINRDMSGAAICVLMSEGNRSCYNLLTICWEMNPNIVLTLDSMNCRGAQIWAGFAGYSNLNFPMFKECVMKRTPEMIDYINLKVPQMRAVLNKS